jgi:hypothetical protein
VITRGYTRRMRIALVAVVVAMTMAVGCAAEKQRADKEAKEEKISAARLSGKFRQDDPLVVMLSPNERGALVRAGMLEDPGESDADVADGDGEGANGFEPDADKTTLDKAGEATVSVLSVLIPLAMTAAPFLLF